MGKTSLIDIADINLDQENAREHDEANRDAIRKSLDRFGAGRSVVIDSNNTIRAGNGTVEIARDAGFKKVLVVEPEPDTIVAVKRADWSEQEAKGYGVADNRAAELAKWNLPGLEAVIASIPDIDIDAIGFGGGQLDALLNTSTGNKEPGDVVEDEPPEPPADPVTQPGDVWLLGRHRVVCGDCCSMMHREDLGLENAAVVLTDPPYAVEYERSADARGGDADVHASYVDPKEASTALAFFDHVPCDVVVMTFPIDRHFFALADALRKNQFEFRKELIWAKNRFSFWPGSKYQQQHEPILLIARKGKPLGAHPPANQSTLLSVESPTRHDKHPTAKPVQLWAMLMGYHTSAGDMVVDPYLGSGTTLVVAEEMGRYCVGSEIAPAYCDVIVERWENLTGQKAKRQKR